MANFAIARTNMIHRQIITAGVRDRRLIAALSVVPRERFVPSRMISLAYTESDILLKAATPARPARYLMAAVPFARLVQEIAIDQQAVVLDIGCATGYSSAVLARLSSSVIALESDEEFAALASRSLIDNGVGNVAVFAAPLGDGWSSAAPYDAIIIEGSVEMIPKALIHQLKVGGRLAAVVGRGLSGSGTIYIKSSCSFSGRRVFNAAVPVLPGFAKPKGFVF